jgi:GNAT-family acetyltransferase (TIGR03103 family)
MVDAALAPPGYERCNRYTKVIVDAALAHGVEVDVLDPATGELLLRRAGREVTTYESLSELTSAVAFRRCDHKPTTRRVLAAAGCSLPAGRIATFDAEDEAFLAQHQDLVVKPARGEGGAGITVGVTERDALGVALAAARDVCAEVLLEQRVDGDDVRVIVIGGEVVAAAVRRPPTIVGDGRSTIAELVTALGRERAEATAGAAHLEADAATEECVRAAGRSTSDVLDAGVHLEVRRTANVHTGGTIEDCTARLHPGLGAAAIVVADAIGIPVSGVDLMVASLDRPEHRVIEVNEQPGLANHEPQPTASRFVELLFPEVRSGDRAGLA